MSENRPALFDLAEWLQTKCTALNLPDLELNFLPPIGTSLALMQTSSPVIEKEYINGSCLNRMEFEIIAQGNFDEKLSLQRTLTTLCELFTEIKDASLSSTRTLLTATSTTPSIRTMTDNGIIQFGISVVVKYKEV